MNNFTDSVLEEDVRLSAASLANDILGAGQKELLDGKTVFVTGATGLIGSQICKTLLQADLDEGLNVTVAAFCRNPEKAAQVFAGYSNDPHFVLAKGDLTADIQYDGPVDYIVHGASPTGSKYFVDHPVETIQTAVYGTDRLLRFARDKQVSGMVYLSSLEVYGVPDGKTETISEKDFGYLDPLSVRSSYSEGKRMVECLCASYASEFEIPVKVVRLSQTFGAGVQYKDGRVFAEFARSVIEHKDIVLHTEGTTVRSYCYTRDAVCAILTVLLKGTPGEAYNVTNMKTACSIRQMADMAAALDPAAGIKVRIEIPENLASFGYNPQMIIRLDNTRLCSLGWKPTVDLEEMFRRTIRSMKERR